MHKWTKNDDTITFYLFKFGLERIPYTKAQIAKRIGVSCGSLAWRLGNFKAITGEGKADHFAPLSLRIYNEFKNTPELAVRKRAFPELSKGK